MANTLILKVVQPFGELSAALPCAGSEMTELMVLPGFFIWCYIF